MPGLDHTVDRRDEEISAETAARNSSRGLKLFAVYLLLYGSFVMANAFVPRWMEWAPVAGVSLAIYAGFALIAAAFALALIYGWLCRDQSNGTTPGENHLP